MQLDSVGVVAERRTRVVDPRIPLPVVVEGVAAAQQVPHVLVKSEPGAVPANVSRDPRAWEPATKVAAPVVTAAAPTQVGLSHIKQVLFRFKFQPVCPMTATRQVRYLNVKYCFGRFEL